MAPGVVRAAFLLALFATACAPPDPLPGFRVATADERAAIARVIEEYYALRDRAVVTGDIRSLYAIHPKLAVAEDRRSGVNVEGWFVERMRSLAIRAVTVDEIEPLRAYVKHGAAVAFVHGVETWEYLSGPPTKGELLVRFDLSLDRDRWVIERTDEWVLGETLPPSSRPRSWR